MDEPWQGGDSLRPRGENRLRLAYTARPRSTLESQLRRSVSRGRWCLLNRQYPDGHWRAELEGDSILQSETILILAFFHRESSELVSLLASRLLETQTAEGGWSLYPGGPLDISATVKAYFALKIAGFDLHEEPIRRARDAILARGGAQSVNSFTRFYLAFLGQIPYSACPAVPPELVLLPRWFPINLYSLSAWSRTMVVPLSIIWALKPVRTLPPEKGIRELFLTRPENWPLTRGSRSARLEWFWSRFFSAVDRLYKLCDRHRLVPLRQKALRAAEAWILQHLEGSHGLGAIYPAMVWSLIALKALGYDEESPLMRTGWRHVEELIISDENNHTARVQPCLSPVWDTTLAVRCLRESGLGIDHPALRRGIHWLLGRQILKPGDWALHTQAQPGGWCFQYANDHYPDCDDTAAVLLALAALFQTESPADGLFPPQWELVNPPDKCEGRLNHPGDDRLSHGRLERLSGEEALADATRAIDRGLKWLLAMQNDDGGWAAFDRNNCCQLLTQVPFADHNAMIDPSTPDVTGRVLEALGNLGYRVGHPAVDRAVRYLRAVQEPDGSWLGRWGVSYIYGTWLALAGLRAVGIPEHDPSVLAGATWLIGHQLPDGGWGETPETYDYPAKRGAGPSTPSQTAWAILGLLAAGKSRHPAVLRGVRYLLDRQQGDGTWAEEAFTGTGFPRVFYLRYHHYPLYFPLMALARFATVNAPYLEELDLPELRVLVPKQDHLSSESRSA